MKDYSVAFTNTTGGVFPNTSGVNASGPSATDGTEFVKLMIDDLWGARQDLMVEAGQTPSGNDEAVGSSDFVLALKHLIGGVKVQSIDAVLAANAMTVSLDKTWLDFRSQTLGSGTVNTRILSSAINVVVSSGSTLGTVNGVLSRIAVLAIDNAGTVELAVVNLAGGNNLDETTRITTVAEGGAGAADTANVIYSTTARANVPFRVVGFIESTQVTAGAWATAPSTIQGMGGNVDVGPKNAINTSKSWVNFNGTGVVVIRDSYNVSSITDSAVGNYIVNFTAAMADDNYCAQINSSAPQSVSLGVCANLLIGSLPTVAGVPVIIQRSDGTDYDADVVTCVVFGNQ